jgi:nitrogen regulatory protein P-II 1
MKQVIAIIQPHMLQKTERALHDLPHFPGFTLMRAKGRGRGHGRDHAFQATDWDLEEHDKVALLILCSDQLAPAVVGVIMENAHTGLRGDGMIAVSDLVDVVRIRSGERGKNAI